MEWWETTIIYQVYPKTFKDSNNDGEGDINGIASKLEHIKNIGVESIWISPMYPSGGKDGGYDISDFRGIDKSFGTMEDFDNMVAKAKRLGKFCVFSSF